MAIQLLQVILEPMPASPRPKYFFFEPGVMDFVVVPGDYPSKGGYITSYVHLEATLVIKSRANSNVMKLRVPQQTINLR